VWTVHPSESSTRFHQDDALHASACGVLSTVTRTARHGMVDDHHTKVVVVVVVLLD
jgi:hypothetical protein